MRICDTMLIRDGYVLSIDDGIKKYRPNQVVDQIINQHDKGIITDGLKISKQGLANSYYIFYLNNYEKRIANNIKSGIILVSSKDNNLDICDRLDALAPSVTVLEENKEQLVKDCKVQIRKMKVNESGLRKLLTKLRNDELEKRLEENLLQETIRM